MIKIAYEGIHGDWVALIKDDVVIYQGHSLDGEKVLETLGIDYEYMGEYDVEEYGEFPEELNDWETNNVKKLRD